MEESELTGRSLTGASMLEAIAWWAWCIAVVAPALAVDSVPFAGYEGIFAAGGRHALRVAALGIPLAVSALAWALAVLLGHARVRHTQFNWGVAVLVLLAGSATALALDPRVALFGFWIDEQGLLVWLLYALVLLLGSQLVASRARLEQFTSVVVGVGGVVAAVALLEVAGLRMFGIPAEEWMYRRGMSTLLNPDFLGTFLVAPAVLAVGTALNTARWRRVLAAALGLLMVVSIAYTLTRGAWIALVAGSTALVVLWFARRRAATREADDAARPAWLRRMAPVLGAVLVATLLIVLLGAGPLASRLASTLRNAGDINSLLSGRITIWSELLPVVADRPLFGVGPGNMVYGWQAFAGEGTLAAQGPGAILDSAHNVPLDLAVQFGLPFALLAVVGSLWLARRSLTSARALAREGDYTGAGFVHAWFAAGVGLGVALLPGATVLPILALASGVLGVQLGIEARPARSSLRTYGRLLVSTLVVAALFVGGFAVLTGYSAVVGDRATPDLAERARRDLVALRIAPWRQGPATDLILVTQQLSSGEQSSVGATEGRAHQMLLDRDKLNALTLYGAGDYQLMVAGEPEHALALAERSLELRPVFVPGLMLKGDALIALGETESGLQHLERAVELESIAATAHSWETPWDSYLQALLRDAPNDPAAAATAREVYARFAERFPGSLLLRDFDAQLKALGS